MVSRGYNFVLLNTMKKLILHTLRGGLVFWDKWNLQYILQMNDTVYFTEITIRFEK